MTDTHDLELIAQRAQTFYEKVKRDAPTCFVPSRELQALFDALDGKKETETNG